MNMLSPSNSTGEISNHCYLGIDGCRAGWAIAIIEREALSLFVVRELSEIAGLINHPASGFIDMPIGLTDFPEGRRCEIEARSIMPATYKPSIFLCPSASAVSAPDFSTANTIQRSITGKGLSIQAWNIVPKIRQVQEQNPLLRNRGIHLREAHPELCFAQLSGNFLPHKKRTKEGQSQRFSVLEKFINLEPATDFLATTKRKHVAVDDVLDSICLAVSACVGAKTGIGNFPQFTHTNEHGNVMEIVYPKRSILFNNK